MPNPPSQAGRFRPKRPAKKIAAGASRTAATAAAAAATSSASSTNDTPRSGRGGRGSGGRGGRGRGRGGRGGRTPLPRGTVFFTGAEKSKSGSSRSKGGGRISRSAASSAATSSSVKKQLGIRQPGSIESDEVIVGELDEAIGASAAGAGGENGGKKLGRPKKGGDSQFGMDETNTNNSSAADYIYAEMYDSDSSMEDERRSRQTKQQQPAILQPSHLPFPRANVPLGIGVATDRPDLYPAEPQSRKDGEGKKTAVDAAATLSDSSPFVDARNPTAKQEEEKSWMLFQFPTRLPIKESSATTAATVVSSSSVVSNNVEEVIPVSQGLFQSQVSTPPLIPTAFDNSLARRNGKLGKLKVYKSGRTILDLGHIKLDVSEGLPCGFVQQAVVIDPMAASYIPLGHVRKTVVVTPQVQQAFDDNNNNNTGDVAHSRA